MSDQVQYSIVKNEQGNIAVQSTVKSFNLDHVTNKDISSFYKAFSQYAAWDTGLLPVDGSGILCIRTAGEYVQFAYQHKPGLYHVNWSSTEGSAATAYYLAQPYRIIICDMYQGNLLGARTFYSPYPITNPSQQLYHVNLPNINCLGYRKNGVGWICLYQNESWDDLPLNERITRFIERCSGVETYNDGNMSETDGPRLYRSNSYPSFLYDPIEWQQKSEQEGFEWTLDESMWIPVLVESMDSQGHHEPNGFPLTFADAIVGDYRAHYYDNKETKPINAIIRPDKELDEKETMSYFIKAYTQANKIDSALLNDTFNQSNSIKAKIGSSVFTHSSLVNAPLNHKDSHDEEEEEEDPENLVYCSACEDSFFKEDDCAIDGENNTLICNYCAENYFIFIKEDGKYYHQESSSLVYDSNKNTYFHLSHHHVVSCEWCESVFGCETSNSLQVSLANASLYKDNEGNNYACVNCLHNVVENNSHFEDCEKLTCQVCQNKFPDHEDVTNSILKVKTIYPSYDNDQEKISYSVIDTHVCSYCSVQSTICPCGFLRTQNDSDINPCTYTQMTHEENGSSVSYIVNQCCSTCLGTATFDGDNVVANYKPFLQEPHKVYISSIKEIKNQSLNLSSVHFIDDTEPF
jgi:hypothetical protein